MPYTVQQLAALANVSVRTLHYYDEVGLLKPSRIRHNGYREYDEPELLRLQQILFFRELDFPIEEIKRVMQSPTFDMRVALQDQRKLLDLKKQRIAGLIKTIDKTLHKLNHRSPMSDEELYDGFDQEQMDTYAKEAKERWGHTEAYQQSMARTKNWTKEDYAKAKRDGDLWMQKVAATAHLGPASDEAQALVLEHYNSLRQFYEPKLEMYRGLGNMFVDDPRFRESFDKHGAGSAEFLRDAIMIFCDRQEAKAP